MHDGGWSTFRGRSHGRPADRRHGAAVRHLPAGPRPDRQPGRRRPGGRDAVRRAAAAPAPRCCCSRRSPRCSSWARSGARARPGSSSPTTPPSSARRSAPGGAREFAEPRLGHRRDPRPAGPGHVRGLEARLERAAHRPRTPAAGVAPQLIALRRAEPALTEQQLGQARFQYDEIDWLVRRLARAIRAAKASRSR